MATSILPTFLRCLRGRTSQIPTRISAPMTAPTRGLAGHSHYHNTRHRKAAVDAKRQKRLQQLSRAIYAAIAVNGRDPGSNPRLARALELARKGGLPRERIDRALTAGPGAVARVEPAKFELVFPGRVGVLVRAAPSHRVAAELRSVARRAGGAIESAAWMFTTRQAVVVAALPQRDVQAAVDAAIDAGASDFEEIRDGDADGEPSSEADEVEMEHGGKGSAQNQIGSTEQDSEQSVQHQPNNAHEFTQLAFICEDRQSLSAVAQELKKLFHGREDVPVFIERETFPNEQVSVDDEQGEKLLVVFEAIEAIPDVVEVLHNVDL